MSSLRVELQVGYTCKSGKSLSYTGQVEREEFIKNGIGGLDGNSHLTVFVPVDAEKGLLPGIAYTCNLLGTTTTDKKPVKSDPFVIKTPAEIVINAPTTLAVENIKADAINQLVSFDVVASPSVENSANYSCKTKITSKSRFSGDVSMADKIDPAMTAERTPVIISVGNSNGEMLPKTDYSCTLSGTARKDSSPVNFPFKISTP